LEVDEVKTNINFYDNEKTVASRKTSFADVLSQKLGPPEVNSSPKEESKADSVPESHAIKENITDQINMDLEIAKPTLNTVNKARPRTSVKRRPSTKAGRKKVTEISVFDDGSNVKDVDTVDSDTVESQKTKASVTRKPSFTPPVGGVSLFGGFNPAEVLKAKKQFKAPLNPDKDQGSQINAPSDNKDKDDVVIEGKETSPMEESFNSKRPSFSKPPMGGVSLFGGFNPADILKSRKGSLEKTAINSSPADFVENNSTPTNVLSQDEDIVEANEPPPMENVEKKTSFDIFGDDDDDDDLFGELLTKSSTKPTNTKSSAMFDLDGEDDDDDLFADLLKK